MFLAFLLLPCFLWGTLGMEYEVCYGASFRLPYQYAAPGFTGKLYFSPKHGEGRRLLLENGKAVDPRVKLSHGTPILYHVTEKDNGYFSVPFGNMFLDRTSLKVLECADAAQRYYHATYRIILPSHAEILEFYQIDQPELVILWNRSNSQTGGTSRGRMRNNAWEISELTQADSGYYNVRQKDYTLLSRKKLTVTEHTKNYVPKEETHFVMRYPLSFTPWDVTFEPSRDDDYYNKPRVLMKSGHQYKNNEISSGSFFEERVFFDDEGMQIDPIKLHDSGVYKFRDTDGNLVFWANVEVEEVQTPAYVYVVLLAALAVAVGICCCCVRKCCCKKKTSKSPASTQEAAAAPAVYYHGTNQSTGPAYPPAPPTATYSYQPANSIFPRQPSPAPARTPAPASSGPPAYNRVDIHPDPNPTQLESSQPGHEVAPAPSVALAFPPSDDDPKFELKGFRFSSDPPLSSDSTFASVYTSDKLNF
ncbi:uncharacterized protein LOC130924167 isoform X2 [Corythoichthys intestinalis]|uniref:uncharacterized protein LOC130924167 isoform X2 n=1 Tax=Corythoichthys intestinalis TaxID=161448 RepID=UPI0025A53261|nr:uncharacterized protein LOC130924167 isoform X2 [Corythoichthys intestinalis]